MENLLTSCKACGGKIGKKVNVCPHCGTKQKNSFLVFLKRFFIFIIIFNIFSYFFENFTEKLLELKAEKQTAQETYTNVGEIIKTDKFEIKIITIEEKEKVGNEFYSAIPAEGGKYLTVVWSYKNITEKPISSVEFPTIKLLDSAKTEYSMDLNATSAFSSEIKQNAKVLSDLNPDITVSSSAVFEVSKNKFDLSAWKLLIDADKDFINNLQ